MSISPAPQNVVLEWMTFAQNFDEHNAQHLALIPQFSDHLLTMVLQSPSPSQARDWCDEWLPHCALHQKLLAHDINWLQRLLPIYHHWDGDQVHHWLRELRKMEWWTIDRDMQLCEVVEYKRQYKSDVVHGLLNLRHGGYLRFVNSPSSVHEVADVLMWFNNGLHVPSGAMSNLIAYCLRHESSWVVEASQKVIELLSTPSHPHPWQGLHLLHYRDVEIISERPSADLLSWICAWEKAFGPVSSVHREQLFEDLQVKGCLSSKYHQDDPMHQASWDEQQQSLHQLQQLVHHWFGDRSARRQLLANTSLHMGECSITHFWAPILDAQDLVFLAAHEHLHPAFKNLPVFQRAVFTQHLDESHVVGMDAHARKM